VLTAPAADAQDVAVDVRRVTVRYGGILALDGASASAPEGRLIGIVGPNGAGKSTLLKAIVGAVPSTGAVAVLGASDRSRRRHVAYVPQREEVNWRFPVSALQVVLMGRASALRRVGRDRRSDRERAEEALDRLGMGGLRRRTIGELSGGQQQRVMLARALFNADARVLLLDEPLSGIDPATRELTLQLLREECDRGCTVLMATHDVAEAARVADRVWGLNKRVVFDGPAARLLDEEVLSRIYGERLLVLPGGELAIGDEVR
jgi:ABC-type Mn2+/Zn2+ transport system ATPase subunit